MGVLLMGEGTPAVRPHMNLNVIKPSSRAVGSSGDMRDEAIGGVGEVVTNDGLPSGQVVGTIDIVNVDDDPPPMRWMAPPPKKKWIRHYLLGELPQLLSTVFLLPESIAELRERFKYFAKLNTKVFGKFSSGAAATLMVIGYVQKGGGVVGHSGVKRKEIICWKMTPLVR